MAATIEGTRRLWRVTLAKQSAGKWRPFAQLNVIQRHERNAMLLGELSLGLSPQAGIAAHAEPLVRITSSERLCRFKAKRLRERLEAKLATLRAEVEEEESKGRARRRFLRGAA